MESQDSDDSLLEDKSSTDDTDHTFSDEEQSHDSDDALLTEHSLTDDHGSSYQSDQKQIVMDCDLTPQGDEVDKDVDCRCAEEKMSSAMDTLDNPAYTDTLQTAEDMSQVKITIQCSEENITATDSLENPAYTDSLSSTDSKKALLGRDYDGNLHCHEVQEPIDHKDLEDDPDIDVIRDRSNTISHLAESTAFIDSLGYHTPDHTRLSRACRNAVLTLSQDIFQKYASTQLLPKEQDIKQQATTEDVEDLTYIARHKKNLIFLSISITLMYTAIGSLRNLQSSLNHQDGIGLYSLAASYCAFMIFSLFTPFVVQKFRPKKCLLYSLIPQLLYVIANLFPTFYLFIPASFLQGLGNALLWNAMSTYTTYLARARALQKDEKTVHVASRYFGIFFFFYQFSIVIGNLISSLILLYGGASNDHHDGKSATVHPEIIMNLNATYGVHDNNMTVSLDSNRHFSFCGARYCHAYSIDHAGMKVSEDTKYTLLGIYGMCVIFSIVVVAYLLDPVKTYRATSTDCKLICKHVFSVLKCLVDKRFLLLSVLFMYSCMQMGFATAEITKAYVTCPVGIYMVGYTMICFGVCGGISSYISGRLDKHLGRISLITTACVIDLGLLLVMAIWQPQPGQGYAYFLLLGGWGVGDGILISQTNSIVSAVFPDMLEEAFAAYRVAQGFGVTVSFMYGSALCMTYKMYILAGTAIVGTILYIILEIILRRCHTGNEKSSSVHDVEA